MGEAKPAFTKGSKVRYLGMLGKVDKVWTIRPGQFKYTVKFRDGKRVLEENELTAA